MMSAEGAAVVLAGRREGPIAEAAREINGNGGKAFARVTDVEDATQARSLIEWTARELGRIDVLVNNAGYAGPVRNIRWTDLDTWNSVLNVNLTAPFVLTQACVPHMLKQGEGTVIVVSSNAAHHPGPLSGPAYAAAKSGAGNFTHFINAEFRARGIRATVIYPGEIDTPILEKRPMPPDEQARTTMMHAGDVAATIMMCVTMPHRTVIEEISMRPRVLRDTRADAEAGWRSGSPESAR